MRVKTSNIINKLAPFLGLAAIFCIFAVLNGKSFISAYNIQTITRHAAIVSMASLGMTMIIVAGGIDLSAGSVIALSAVVVATFLQSGFTPAQAAAAGTLAGALCGLANGLIVTRLRVVPFIVTLGTMLVIRGAAKGLAHEQKVEITVPMGPLQSLLTSLPDERKWMIFPPGAWAIFALAIMVTLFMRFTQVGRHIFAVGSNEHAARLCGVPVNRVKILVYLLGATFAGLAGVLQCSRLTVGDPTGAVNAELEVIAAVVIGGGSLAGGEGSVLGSLIGALIMAVIRSGCSQLGIDNWVQEIITGCIIIVAVALDRLRHQRLRESG